MFLLTGPQCMHSWGHNGGCSQAVRERGHLGFNHNGLRRLLHGVGHAAASRRSAWTSLLGKCFGDEELQSAGSTVCEDLSTFTADTLYFRNRAWLALIQLGPAAVVARELSGFVPQEAFRALLLSRRLAKYPGTREVKLSTAQLLELTEGTGGVHDTMDALRAAGVLLPQVQADDSDW